jgi:ribonuclease G
LQEVLVERTSKRGMVGNIYRGTVSRVLPGMEAAFIDIGLDKSAFLHASDLTMPNLNMDDFINADGSRPLPAPTPHIGSFLHEGKKLLVQVIKDPLGTKGARLTTYITIPSRYLVFMPDSSNTGVSSKIESPQERERLRQFMMQLREEFSDQYGYIVRTAAEGIGLEELRRDMRFLRNLWQNI